MRYREDNPADLVRARAAVAAWRQEHPDGSYEDVVADLGLDFHKDYGVVLRGVLFALDRHQAMITAGITIITGAAR